MTTPDPSTGRSTDSMAHHLRDQLRGRLFTPADDGFGAASTPWNLAVHQDVGAVVEAADADDVAAVVRYAAGTGLAVATQASGHGATGLTGDRGDVILLRMAALDHIEVVTASPGVRAGAGVRWGQVQEVAGPLGLTGLPGSSPVVSVVGYVLGGGLGWFSRRHGFGSSSIRAFEVVTAEGTRARVTETSEPDLFWAMRGGGGDFAVVTAVELDLYAAPELYGGRMLWPADRAPQVLDAYRDVTADAPDLLTVWFDLLQFPESPPLVAVDVTYLGPESGGQSLLRRFDAVGGLLSDTRSPLPPANLGSITAEPTEPSPGIPRGELLVDLSDGAAEALLAAPIDPLVSVQLRHLGGALATPSDSAAGHLDEPYSLYMLGAPTSAEVGARIRARQEEIVEALGPAASGRKHFTNLRPGETAAAAFPAPTLARLQEVKLRRDPKNTLRSNYPVLAVT